MGKRGRPTKSVDMRKLARLWKNNNLTIDEIGAELGISRKQAWTLAKWLKLPPRRMGRPKR